MHSRIYLHAKKIYLDNINTIGLFEDIVKLDQHKQVVKICILKHVDF